MLYYGWVQLAWINSSRQFDIVCKNNLFWSFSNSQKKEEERKGKRANRERQGCRGSQTLCQWCRDMEEMERRIQMKQTERKPDKTLEGKQKEQAGAAAAFGQRGRTKYMPITVFAWRELFPHKISSCNCTLYAFVHSLKVYTTYSACTVLQSLLWHPTCNYIGLPQSCHSVSALLLSILSKSVSRILNPWVKFDCCAQFSALL